MRNKRVDILRCIAVLLVLGRHGLVEGVWKEAGWAGVDLFFVLSGFLISGLFFGEYKRKGNIGIRRFFIRRGMKIYPAFYVMLLTTFLVAEAYGVHVPLGPWLREIFFVQNYKHAIWRHTWSLAVEEHFYILLPLFLLALTKLSRKRVDPFGAIPVVFCILAPLILMMRVVTAYQPGFEFEDTPRIMFPTHMRVDALFFGVLLGYLHHFRPQFIPNLLKSRRNRLLAALLTCLSLSCILATYAESRFMLSFGLTLLYLGFGGALVLFLYAEAPAAAFWGRAGEKLGAALAGVGRYSYSIYLWHVPVVTHALPALHAMIPVPLAQALYVALSIGVGIAMARLVEFPALALRDRLFPGVSGAAAVVKVQSFKPPMAGLQEEAEEEVVAGSAVDR